MLRSRFESVPSAFNERLVPMQTEEHKNEHHVMLNFFSFMLNLIWMETL